MITDVYSHILDEDRRFNAQKFEEQFYNIKGIKVDEDTRVAVQNFDSLILNKKKATHREKMIMIQKQAILLMLNY